MLLNSCIIMALEKIISYGNCENIVSLNKLSILFSLYSSGTPIIHRLFVLMIPHCSCRLSTPFFIFFVCAPLGNFKGPVFYA